MEFPVISMKLLEEESPGHDEMARLAQACQEWEYFQLIDHGVPTETMDAIAESFKSFFKLPLEEKVNETGNEEGVRKPVYDNKGVPLLGTHKLGYNKNGVAVFRVHGQCDEPPEDPKHEGWVQQIILPCSPVVGSPEINWPTKPDGLQEKIDNYVKETQRVGEKILRCLAVNVGLKPDAFVDAFGGRDSATMMMIVNCMPAVPLGAAALTAPRHRDISGLSVLLVVDGCQGFQVFKDGQWWSVPWMNRHALVVNSGDLMQVISNGRYKSLVHRAINLGDMMRISIASVYNPKKFAKIGPIAELIDEDHPCLYGEGRHADFLEAVRAKPMTCFQYFGSLNC